MREADSASRIVVSNGAAGSGAAATRAMTPAGSAAPVVAASPGTPPGS